MRGAVLRDVETAPPPVYPLVASTALRSDPTGPSACPAMSGISAGMIGSRTARKPRGQPTEAPQRDLLDDGRVITGRPVTIGTAFASEATTLMPPGERFHPARLLEARVDNRARVSVRQCFYSVPARYPGRRLAVHRPGKLLSPGATPGRRAPPDQNHGPQRAVRLSGHRSAPRNATQRRELPATTPTDPDTALRAWLREWAAGHPRRGFRNAYWDARDA